MYPVVVDATRQAMNEFSDTFKALPSFTAPEDGCLTPAMIDAYHYRQAGVIILE